jgi:hypothetical protein
MPSTHLGLNISLDVIQCSWDQHGIGCVLDWTSYFEYILSNTIILRLEYDLFT